MIENLTGISTDYVVLGILAVCVVLFIMFIVLSIRFSSLKKRYLKFMEGKDAMTLEDSLIVRLDQVDELIASNNENERNIEAINKKMQLSIDKYALVKYDALEELGGKLSFSLCLLDERNNGFILNNMHGRDGSYCYLKEVINGNTVANLSEEEKSALDKAISGEDR